MVKLICLGWSGMPKSKPASVLPHHADDDALDLHLIGLGEDGLHGGVGRLQTDHAARVAVELLERHVRPAKQRNHHLAVVGRLAILDHHVVAVADLLVDHRIAAHAQHVGVALADQIFGHRDRLVRRDRLNRQARGDVAEKRKLDGAPAGARRHHLDRPAAVPGPLDEAFFLQVGQMLVHRRERRKAESPSDFFQTWRVAVLLDELVQVVEDLALALGEWKHVRWPSGESSALTIRKRKAKVKISVKADGRGLLRFGDVRIPFTIARQGIQGRPFDVVGLGENSVDLMAVVAEYPVSNTKQRLQRFARQSGGQIATALVACAKLGWKARYIGRFGEDEFGAFSRDSLTAAGVDVSAARTVAGATNQFAVILVDARTGARTVLWDRHPGLTMEAGDVREDAVTSGRMLLVDCQDPGAAAQAARYARQAHIPTVIEVEKVRPGILEVLQQIDAIIAAEDFPTALTGHEDLGRGLEAMARESNAPLVCVTLRAKGSLARQRRGKV